jgi:peptidoglycan/LPS O-acetylase OafA/YrhL
MRHKIPQLDAVRGIAVLLVMMVHASDKYPSLHLRPAFQNGWMGVDLFFVLSGFLITGILMETKTSEGYFQNFYVRRCLRIWPLYYSLLIFMFILVPLLRPSDAHVVFEQRSSPWWAYPLFLQNFLVPIPTMATGPLGVTWSLAIEEQFYLVWPLIVRFCNPNQLRRIAIAVICISPALRYYLSTHGIITYSNVFCRLDGLMAGALLALMVQVQGFAPMSFVKRAWILLFVAAPLALISQQLNAQWIVFSFTALGSVAFVYLAMFSSQPWLQAVLRNRFLIFTGTISYGLYLLHKIPMDMAQTFHLDRYPALALPVTFAAAFLLAFLSWNIIEKPFLGLKRFFKSRPLPLDTTASPSPLTTGPPGIDLPH